jgi:hypothetical protein
MKAFPIMFKHPTTGAIIENQGMELRDYFAGKALAVAIQQTKDYYGIDQVYVATWCYEMADAMIKQREVKNV